MKGTLARAREALASRDFRHLFAARLISQAADGLFQIAVLDQLVFDAPGEHTAIGFAKAVAVLAIPYSLIGPFTGVFIDRWSRRRILAWTPLYRAAAALLTLAGPEAALPYYAGALVVISANRFFLSTATAVMPRLVRAEDLLIGNSIATVGGTVATFVGAAAGGFLAEAIGSGALIVVIGTMWVVAATVAAFIRTALRAEGGPTEALRHALVRVAGETGDGFRLLVRTRTALFPIASITLDQFVQGLILMISVVVFRDRFQEGVGSFSWLVAAGGTGILVGLLTVGSLEPRWSRPTIVAASFALSGLALVGVAPVIGRVTVLVAAFLLGLGFAWKKIPVDTMVQEAVPDGFRGRVFAVYDVGYNMSRVVAAGLGVAVLPAIGVPWAIGLSGALFLLWAPVLPRQMRRARAEPAPVEVLFYAGSRADEVPRAVVIGGVERPVTLDRAWVEDRDGERLRVFRLILPDGSPLRVAGPADGGGAWRLDPSRPGKPDR
ncbi:MAG: MFS transporter [Actinobacteria bacterium]|nr:MFS transporter [Actinomycetota bacterium]